MTDDLQAKDQVQVATPEELAAAREARGMSQVDISQRIKLQVKQVKALEQGEWDALPGRSFVRGALRSYGKLIDVDVSPLLESIGGFAEPTQVEGITPLDAPIDHDETGFANNADVFERVARDADQVGAFAGGEHPEIGAAHQRSGRTRCCL